MTNNTTIQVSVKTKNKLNKHKIHIRETYDDMINRLIDTYRNTK